MSKKPHKYICAIVVETDAPVLFKELEKQIPFGLQGTNLEADPPRDDWARITKVRVRSVDRDR